MLYSLLEDRDTYFIKLHAECALHTYSSEFLHAEILSEVKRTKGIFCNKLNADIIENIRNYTYMEKNICLDFENIEEITENNFINLVSFLKNCFCAQNKTVFLINLSADIYKRLGEEKDFQTSKTKDELSWGWIGQYESKCTCQDLIHKQEVLFQEELDKLIVNATDTKEQIVHASTSVYLSKYINLKRMIESNPRMLRLCIYYLAKKLIAEEYISCNPAQNTGISLFFHTMNGGYLAAQLADLLQVDLIYLDHLGPIESVHRKHFEKSIQDSRSYIIVSDVICLGGEVGRAKTIIEYCGGKVLATISLVDIRTIQSQLMNSRISLYTISKECNKIGYTICTDFCEECLRK